MCVCVCVCERERVCVCVERGLCVHVFVCMFVCYIERLKEREEGWVFGCLCVF